MARVDETLLDIQIGRDSITWGGWFFDKEICLFLRNDGFYKRKNETFVLPHAVGCQVPTLNEEYVSILKGFFDNN